ncbi:MAG: septal ring lytic transglycosylase RlpA family protein [Solirubrobacteraceae bacterium]|jgi:rare lipoprotein A (peptidoglycan hydrolase)
MQIDFKKSTLLALIAATAFAVIPCVSASAATGGSSAPGSATAQPGSPTAAKKAHPSAIATWFGPGFYGQKTACGQTLTPGVVGVANRTLPCGTLVKVSYRNHTLTVPVLDRGPYSSIGAEWDLTAGAAEALNISETVRIKTHVVGITPNTPTLGLPAGSPTAALVGAAVAG